jgi:hypothetical protein
LTAFGIKTMAISMIDPSNPVNRLAKALGMQAADLADALPVTPRHFRTLSENRPDELLDMILQNAPIRLSEEASSSDGTELGAKDKADFADALLRQPTRKTEEIVKDVDAHHIYLVENTKKECRFVVDDLMPGTPVTKGGNVVIPDFSRLLHLRKEWHKFIATVSSDSGVACDVAWKKCQKKFQYGFTPEQFAEACAEEIRAVSADSTEIVLRVLVPISEYFIIRVIFRKMQKHLERVDRKGDNSAVKLGEFERYRTWFMVNFSIPQEQFKSAVQEGRIALHEEGAEKRIQEGKIYPSPENLRVGLCQLSYLPQFLRKDSRA